jgi:hypothetical protein
MRIFIGYGYNERDKWIEYLVFPLIESFGAEVISGKEIHGRVISNAIQNQIEQSDALIAFLTKREDTGVTHRWVSDELSIGIANKIQVLEVREIGVNDQGGIAGDRQRIEYDENQRDKCLVEIAKAVGRWQHKTNVNIKLLPQEFVDNVRPLVKRPEFKCTYNLIDGRTERFDVTADVRPITGGLFVNLKNVSKEALVQINISTQDNSWTSDFEPVEQYKINLYKEQGTD